MAELSADQARGLAKALIEAADPTTLQNTSGSFA